MQDIPLCPVLQPTYQQFINFREYVNNVEEKYKKDFGMVKIIPPPQWQSKSNNYHKILNSLEIKQPEHQTLYGSRNNYFYLCENGRTNQTFTLSQYRDISNKKMQQISHYTSMQAIQRHFWQNISSMKKQIYCANIEQTLMDENSGSWHFQKLQSMFNYAIKEKLEGLNTSFLFIGSWKTFFNWHVQELDLSALNILHEGATKMWYAVHPEDRLKFQRVIKDLFPQQAIKCSNFLRHKSTFTNPYKLIEKHPYLRISKMYQNQGEISLAFSQAFHCGFNMGFNIAEAINYAVDSWLDKFVKFRRCKCPMSIGVVVQNQQIIANLQNSVIYTKIKNYESFKKIKQRAQIQKKQDEQFEKLPKSQIYEQFLKEKTKRINKGQKNIYITKYKRYFPTNYTLEQDTIMIQCDKCQKWLKTTQDQVNKYKNKHFYCKFIGRQCNTFKRHKKVKQQTIKQQQQQKQYQNQQTIKTRNQKRF